MSAAGARTGRPGLRAPARAAWRAIENRLDAWVTPAANPLRHLGAVGFLAFWLLAGSGIVLYAVFDTSVAGAWRSIQQLEEAPLALGRLLRGLHRYAADVLVLALMAHIAREWLFAHERGARRYAWLTGVPLVALVAALAIGGFWLNWDQLGAFSATATAEWIDALPGLGTSLARNFIGVEAVSDRLFSLFVFVHLGLPLLLLFGLWFHIQRLTRAAVLPPRRLGALLVGALAFAALAWPVLSHPGATLAQVPAALRLDWMLLFIHPLTDAAGAGWTWAAAVAFIGLLFAVALWPRPADPPADRSTETGACRHAGGAAPAAAVEAAGAAPAAQAAVVDPAHCNGCQRCFADCPFAAVSMVPHPNQRIGRTLAVVDADLCAACGICAGACPSSTPFRRGEALVTGIDMPGLPMSALRAQLRAGLAKLRSPRPLVVFRCRHGAAVDAAADVVPIDLVCAGQLAPSFIDYALRDGAAGVLVTACREGGCEFRHGETLTAERLQGRREPQLRLHAEGEVALVHAGAGDGRLVQAALARLRAAVARGAGDAAGTVSAAGVS